MILKNYWRWLQATQRYPVDETNTIDVGLKNISGASQNIILGCPGSTVGASLQSLIAKNRCLDNVTFRIGTGTTEPTADDYALANDVTANISDLTVTKGWNATDGYNRIYTVTGTNNMASAITVTQLGVCLGITADSEYTTNLVMMAVVVLEEPLTVAAGDTFTFSVNWAEQ